MTDSANNDLSTYNSYEALSEYFTINYSENATPISISFKELISSLRSERYTHLIHPYPAKLLMHIPYFFLNNSVFSKPGDIVLDPFCGTGTVMLEANIAGRNALGADSNPLARLVAKVKTSRYDKKKLDKYLKTIIAYAQSSKNIELPDVRNIDFWFPARTQNQLGKLKKAIDSITDNHYQDFFYVCFSNCVGKVSYADPRIKVPVKLNPQRFAEDSSEYKKVIKRLADLEEMDVISKFEMICLENIFRCSQTFPVYDGVFSKVISSDALNLTSDLDSKSLLKENSVDLIITSPPYAGAQKYIRSSSLSLGWLGLGSSENLKKLDKKNIGREDYSKGELKIFKTGIATADQLLEKLFQINLERAYIVANYIDKMKAALRESLRVLKPEGYLVIIIGNNKVCDCEFDTQDYLTTYLESLNAQLQFKLIDDIKSYGLMTKRNKTADRISREYVLVFKKK